MDLASSAIAIQYGKYYSDSLTVDLGVKSLLLSFQCIQYIAERLLPLARYC